MSSPTLGLVRRWAVDWLGGQHPEVCQQVLAPEYALLIGGYLLGPREQYVPATMAQLSRYPGLIVTVHEVVSSQDRVAIVFTESGRSARLDRTAAWSGVSLFRSDGERLTHCWAEEDYYGRRRQLDTGRSDPVDRPAPAPWDTAPEPARPAAEQVVRDWLDGPDLRSAPVVCDDEGTGQPAHHLLDVDACEVLELFSAGADVAFAAVQNGSYAGGLDGLDHMVGRPAQVRLAGVVRVDDDGRVVGGRVVRDRLGLARTLEEESRGDGA